MANLIEENYSDYRSAFLADPFLGIRMGYFLDRVFQRFLDKLVQYVHKKRPLRSAAKELKGFQREEVNRVFANMGSGVFPNIPLPRSLSGGAPPQLPPISRPSGSPPNFDKSAKKGDANRVNHGAVSAWALPVDKTYADFFDTKRQPQNLKGWPMFDHHFRWGKQKPCIKFQVHGTCKAQNTCTFSHFDPRNIDPDTHAKLAAKFKGIYKN
jgi:hypothetical protein